MFSDVINGETLCTEGEYNWYEDFGISHKGRQLVSVSSTALRSTLDVL